MPILSRLGLIHGWGLTDGGWDLSERLDRLAVHADVATFLGSISASTDTVESEGQQMKQCWITYIKKKKSYKIPHWIFSRDPVCVISFLRNYLLVQYYTCMHYILDKNVRFVLVKTELTALDAFTVRSRIHFVFKFLCLVFLSVCWPWLFFIPALNSTEWNVNIITGLPVLLVFNPFTCLLLTEAITPVFSCSYINNKQSKSLSSIWLAMMYIQCTIARLPIMSFIIHNYDIMYHTFNVTFNVFVPRDWDRTKKTLGIWDVLNLMIFETQDQIRNKTKYFFFQEPELIMRKSSPVQYTQEYLQVNKCVLWTAPCVLTLFITWPVPLSENAFVQPPTHITRVRLNNFLSAFFANLFEFFFNFSFPEYLSRKLTKFRLFFANCSGKRRKSSTIFGFRSISLLVLHLFSFHF